MATNATTEPTDDVPNLSGHDFVGVDKEGAEHYWDGYEGEIIVIEDDGAVDTVDNIQPGHLGQWVVHIRERRGWDDLRYVEGEGLAALAEMLVESMAGGLREGEEDA